MYSFYVFVLSAVILPVAFIAISLPVVLWKMHRTADISPAMYHFPKCGTIRSMCTAFLIVVL